MRVEEVRTPGGIVVEKRLSARERAEPEAIARLRSETTLLERLGGLVTPRLVERGEDERGPWFRAEKIPFATLAQRIESAAAPLDARWIERAIGGAFDALAKLHDHADEAGPLHIVHADLSPANVAIDDDGARAVLLDLELACWRESPPRDGAFRGTARYVAPEVARGEAPHPASDLFALAASFLHAATGAAPRDAPSLAAILAQAAEEPVLRPAHEQLASRGPGHAAMLACLALDASARPASAREVLAGILC